MPEEKDNEKEHPRNFDEIERKLREALARKKGEPEADLKTRKMKEEPKRSVEPIKSVEEKEALTSIENVVNELKVKVEGVKNKIKEHLTKVTKFQKEIENLTGQTVKEFEKMKELSLSLEGIGQEVRDKISSIKKEPEEEFKKIEKPPKREAEYEEGIDFGEELARVKKLKDMLRKQETERAEGKVEEKVEKKPAPGVAEETVEAKEEEFHFVIGEKPEEMETQLAEMEKAIEEAPPPEKPKEAVFREKEETKVAPAVEKEKIKEEPAFAKGPEPEFKLDETLETMFSGRWKKHWQEAAAEKKEEKVEPKEFAVPQKRRASDFAELLTSYRKTDPPEEGAEVWYYQNNEKVVLDSECIILALGTHLTETKKLYTKLSQTTSPREQFFIKQEIIRHQESLRDAFMRSIKLLEKSSCTLPKFTIDIVSKEFLKEILEKLSIENWSNQDDFTFFEENMEKVKSDFNQRITPKVEYLKSIIEQLGV